MLANLIDCLVAKGAGVVLANLINCLVGKGAGVVLANLIDGPRGRHFHQLLPALGPSTAEIDSHRQYRPLLHQARP